MHNNSDVTLEKLTKRSEFLLVAKTKNYRATSSLILQWRAWSQDEIDARHNFLSMRFGVTASKKVGNAVIRNRIKRRLRHLAKEHLPIFAPTFFDYVLIGRKSTYDVEFSRLIKDLEFACKFIKKEVPRKSNSN